MAGWMEKVRDVAAWFKTKQDIRHLESEMPKMSPGTLQFMLAVTGGDSTRINQLLNFRDDIDFDNQEVKKYASQGFTRSCVAEKNAMVIALLQASETLISSEHARAMLEGAIAGRDTVTALAIANARPKILLEKGLMDTPIATAIYISRDEVATALTNVLLENCEMDGALRELARVREKLLPATRRSMYGMITARLEVSDVGGSVTEGRSSLAEKVVAERSKNNLGGGAVHK